MATTPPIYSFPGLYYNPVFFPSISGFLTLSQANTLYLARSGVASSVAILTSFTGAVTVSGLLTLNGGLTLTGGLTVDTLTVNTLSTLNTNTIINNILTINATNSIVGQTTFTLAPILPANYQFITINSQTIDGTKTFTSIPILPAGYQFLTTGTQTISGLKTFSSVITSNGINDSLSITSPTITGSTIVNAGTFSATNIAGTSFLYGTSIGGTLSCNIITNTSSTLPYILNCLSVPIPTTTSTVSGLGIGWNSVNGGGTGECDLINYGQYGAGGGFNFSTITNASVNRNLGLLSIFANGGFTINPACGQLRIQDVNSGTSNLTIVQQGATTYFNSNGITTTMAFPVSNSLGALVNVLLLGDNFVAPYAPFLPQSTSAFNFFHPTTTLGNNLSTNTTQYATVGYVNSSIPTSLLGLNNTWTGQNSFTQNYISVSSIPYRFGGSVGNVGSIILGDTSCLTATTANVGNICVGFVSQLLTTGTNNISMGTRCLRDTTTGGQNTAIGYQCLTNVTTGSNNTCIGSSSGLTILTGNNNTFLGANASGLGQFSFSTALGTNSVVSASNQIMLGSSGDTVQCPNNINVSNNLTVTNNATISGMILQPILSFTTGVSNTFTTIPPYIIYTPAVGQGFILPPPSAGNAGMRFVIRRAAAGSGSTIIFSCTGNPLVWVILNSTVGTASYAVASLGPSQSEWFCSGTFFYQLI